MKHCLTLLATLVLAVGCKTDGESSSAGSAAPAAEQSAAHSGNGRSGKIDLPQRRRPAVPDGDDSAQPERVERPRLSDEERAARREERRQERMAELDTNGDGTISEEERQAARKARLEEMHSRFDADGDGKLTVDELAGSRMARRFGDLSAIDTDKNGEISAEELQKQMDTMRAQGWGRRGAWRGRDGQDGPPPPPAEPQK